MLRAALLVTLLVQAAPASALDITYVTSRTHGLVNFVETISGDPHRSRTLKAAFDGSRFDTPEAQRRLAAFRDLLPALKAAVVFPGFPESRGVGNNLDKLVLSQSAFVPDQGGVQTLRRITTGQMPPAVQSGLFTALEAFEPAYDTLVWTAARPKIERYAKNLTAKSRAWKASALLDKVAKFYGAEWPNDTPVVIALYPMPGKDGHSMAESIYALGSVGVFADETDVPTRFGCVIHEIAHSLYEAQPAALQHAQETWFTESPSPYGRMTYDLLNEGLATAIGNGWAVRQTKGHMPADALYNDRKTDLFARELLPLVERYLEAGRTIDAAFAAEAISRFEKAFPDALSEYETLFRDIVIATGGALDARDVGTRLRRAFRIPNISRLSPLASDETLEGITSRSGTVILALTPGEMDQLEGLAERMPLVKERLEELRKAETDYVYAATGADGRTLVVIRVKDAAQLDGAIARLKKEARIDAKRALTTL